MSFEPRDYLRHILIEADYLIGRSEGLSFDVHLVRIDPTLGSEIRKTRPCVVVSPLGLRGA